MAGTSRQRMVPKGGSGGSGNISGTTVPEQVCFGDTTPNTITSSPKLRFDGSNYVLNARTSVRRVTDSNIDALMNFSNGLGRKNQVYKYFSTNADADFFYPSQYNKEVVLLPDNDYAIDSIDTDTDNGKLFIYGNPPLTAQRIIRLPASPQTGYTYRIVNLDDSLNGIVISGNGNNILSNSFITTTMETSAVSSAVEVYYNGATWDIIQITGQWKVSGSNTLVFDTPMRTVITGQNVVASAAFGTTYSTISGCDPSLGGQLDKANSVLPNSILEKIRFNIYSNTSSVDIDINVCINGSPAYSITIAAGDTGVIDRYIGIQIANTDLVCLEIRPSSVGTGQFETSQITTSVILLDA